ncbi:MAG: hypothetical protein K1X55_17320 [Chitinophagales bacterium]|nr:hypothetical protein [Chitinophagales bacterium]
MKNIFILITLFILLSCKKNAPNTKNNFELNPLLVSIVEDYQKSERGNRSGHFILFCENVYSTSYRSYLLTKIFSKNEFDFIQPEICAKYNSKNILIKCGLKMVVTDNFSSQQLVNIRNELADKGELNNPMVWRITLLKDSLVVEKQGVTIVPIKKIDFVPPK